MQKIWERLGLEQRDWRKLAEAFYDLAHNDTRKFDLLDDHLKATPAGVLCSRYIRTRDHGLVDQAGKLITGSAHWYVYLGRIM